MMDFHITRFAYPAFLVLAAVVPLLIGYYVYRCRQGGAAIQISSTAGVSRLHTYKYYLRHLPFILRCMALLLLVTALARPQSSKTGSNSVTEGIDIMLVVDISGSMLARDFKPDRISAARETAAKFIADRVNDRMGIVVFAGESFTQSPLTTDKRALTNLLSGIKSGVIDDGTAIGSGLATAVNRLKDSDAESKVAVLLTDGVNNAGQIAPLTAAEIAASYGIRVYTIGIGTTGMAPYPAMDIWGGITFVPMKVEIDEKILTDISRLTGGEYFRATDNNSLENVYDKINELERSRIENSTFVVHKELFQGFALIGLALLAFEFIIRYLLLRRIP